MSGFTSRSPSPNQNRSARSGRTPESSSSVRRSVDLSHYNHKLSSPSDSSHKGFNSKHFSSQKENERDPSSLSKPGIKGRSPSPSSSHKGFMAPTISASSKGRSPVLPSPRARAVLSERNQNPTTQIEENFSKTDSKTSPVVPKLVQLESEPTISLPPYDPKTNYLSPRPQYLHYKPIPRIELYKKGELDLFDARNLEDSFSSESSESSVKTEEEESSPPSELIETEETETEAVSSEIESPETELGIPITNATERTKLKIAPLALIMLLIGCIFLPLSDSPVQTPNSDFKSPHLHFSSFETRLMEFSSKLTHWSTHSIQYFSNLFATQAPFPIEIGTFPLANLSSKALDETGSLDSNLAWPIFNEIEAESEVEEKNMTVSFETVIENEDVKEMEDRFEIATKIEEEEDDNKEKVEEESEMGFRSESVTEKNPQEFSSTEAVNEMDSGLDKGFVPEPVKIENAEESINEESNGFESEPVKEGSINEESNGFESEPVKEESINEVDNGFGSSNLAVSAEELTSSVFELSEQLISNRAIEIIAAVAITSLGSLLLLSTYKNKKRDSKNRDSVSQPTEEKPITTTPVKEKSGTSNSCSGSSESHAKNSPMETSSVDMEAEFSTSFDGTRFSSGTGTMDRRRDSMERFARRESDVSIDSFGSFTTYEKISSKKVNGDEVTTPVTVRRSSRIRSRVSLNST